MLAPFLGSPDDGKARGEPIDPGARIVRDRQGVLRAAIGRAARRSAMTASRCLVSVYNGGEMPTQPDHIFLTHPVELDGAEAEGGPSSPNVDTSATIPVVVIRDSPQVGDLLVASSVGGRWVAERTGGHTTVCVSVCGGIPVVGATVGVYMNGVLEGSCTTGTNGCCTIPLSGTYLVQVMASGQIVYSATRTLSPGGTTTVALSGNAPVVCCGGYAIPETLTLTDAAGSLSFVYYPNSFYPTWYGGHAVQRASCSVTTPNNICVAAPASQGPVRVCYQMICYAGQDPTFAIQRSWSWVYLPGTLTPIWYQDPSGFVAGQPCTTGPPAMCGSPHTDVSTDAKNPRTTNPFEISFNPTPAVSNDTSDPVGGSISITQLAAQGPPDDIPVPHLRARSAAAGPMISGADPAHDSDRPAVPEALALVKAMKACPFRSTDPGCGCAGGRCALRRGAVVSHPDCFDCLRRYAGPHEA